jgi:hypothetical protein
MVMKKNLKNIITCILLFSCAVLISMPASAKKIKKDLYQIKIYSLKNNEQVNTVDLWLKNSFLPAMHRAGVLKIGVFKPIANDTAAVKKIYVFIPFTSVDQFQKMPGMLQKDDAFITASKDFTAAPADRAPYERMESILLEAFPMHPHFSLTSLKSSVNDKIYELRSYESPTEDLHIKKMKMFNEGGEIGLFDRLGFNAVFYARVISGSRMPNLMYMTTFENMAEHDAHWKAFSNDPFWKKISAMPEYENKVSVSRNDRTLMHATDYSDI